MVPIKVLFLSDHLGHASGVSHGGTTYFRTVLSAFDRSEIDARLVILGHDHPQREQFEAAGIPLTILNRGKWDFRAYRDLKRYLADWPADVIHMHTMKAYLLGRWLARGNTRTIMHFHDVRSPGSLVRLAQTWTARKPDAAVAVSGFVRDVTAPYYGVDSDSTAVIHNGLDLTRFSDAPSRAVVRAELGIPEDACVFSVIGRFAHEKGQQDAIEAFARLSPDLLSKARLVLIGDGPDRVRAEERVAALGLTDRIHFTGFRTDIERLLRAVDCALVPSIVGEGFPYSALEAQAAGVPVLAYRSGALPDTLKDGVTGRLVPPGEVAALSSAMADMLADPDQRGAMGGAALDWIKQFAVVRHVEAMTDLYRQLTSNQTVENVQGAGGGLPQGKLSTTT